MTGSVAFERSVVGVAATRGGPGRDVKAENAGLGALDTGLGAALDKDS